MDKIYCVFIWNERKGVVEVLGHYKKSNKALEESKDRWDFQTQTTWVGHLDRDTKVSTNPTMRNKKS